MYCYIFRSVCLFWSKQAKTILKNIKILLLIAQFHNAPSNFANLASGRRALAAGAHNLFRNNGKKSTFSQNLSDNDAKKNRLQDLYDVFDLHV